MNRSAIIQELRTEAEAVQAEKDASHARLKQLRDELREEDAKHVALSQRWSDIQSAIDLLRKTDR